MVKEIVVGTRDSALALWQTHWVVDKLKKLNPEYSFRIVSMKTQGDKILDVALAKIGDKGLFTKELELGMLKGEIDFAVHSMKDLPTVLPEGLMIGAVCEREDPRDVLVSNGIALEDMPVGARIGTSSLRRSSQLLNYRPDLQLEPLRGNLNTRISKLEKEKLDGIVLAAAGVKRLGWEDRITEYISPDICLPAVGQGSIGIEIREDNKEVYHVVQTINHPPSEAAIKAERGLMKKLEGGCQIPIGALGVVEGEQLTLKGVVGSLDGKRLVSSQITGTIDEAQSLGEKLAQILIEMGAGDILKSVRREFV